MTPEALAFIKDFVWAPFLGLVGWAWHHITKQHESIGTRLTQHEVDMRAHVDSQLARQQAYTDSRVMELTVETDRQRDVSAKIFDKLENIQQRSEDRHMELIKALHEGLSKKADK